LRLVPSQEVYAQRFWTKVDKTPGLGPNGDCWEWTDHLSTQGYGRASFMNRQVYAHRLSFFLHHGRWPDNFACHHCDNRKCIRPEHIFDGTRSDNMRDAYQKGRICPEAATRRRCPSGHEYTAENTMLVKNRKDGFKTWRVCLTCSRRISLECYYRKKFKRISALTGRQV
jgi:hypothetical protein